MARLETRLSANLEAPGSARRFVRAALATRDLDGVGAIAELLTSELVTNVVCHVGSAVTVRLIMNEGPAIRVEVDDSSTVPPVLRESGAEAPSGNGLVLLDGLATRWDAELRPDGKTVWFELDIRAEGFAGAVPPGTIIG